MNIPVLLCGCMLLPNFHLLLQPKPDKGTKYEIERGREGERSGSWVDASFSAKLQG